MKLEPDLLRQIAFQMENWSRDTPTEGMLVDGYSPEQIGEHLEHMFDAELFSGCDATFSTAPYQRYIFFKLLPAGRDFISAARNDTTWSKFKKTVGPYAPATIGAIIKALADAATH